MVVNKLTINVDAAWIEQFNAGGMKLCFASAVDAAGSSRYNVVAYADTVADTVTIEWEEEYLIAATKAKFADGAKFTTATKPQAIEFGQSFRIDDTWTTKPVNPDKDAPKAGFLFVNDTVSSCVVYKKVNGKPAPVYLSAGGPLPPGREALVPKSKCKVWFSSAHETSSMVSVFAGRFKEVDFTGTTDASVWYTSGGLWANSAP